MPSVLYKIMYISRALLALQTCTSDNDARYLFSIVGWDRELLQTSTICDGGHAKTLP